MTTSPSNKTVPKWEYGRSDRSKRNGSLRRRFRDWRRRVTKPLVPMLAPLLLRAIARTWRVRWINGERKETVLRSPEGCIPVLWHGRMATAAPVFRGVQAVILVSASGDGEMADMLLKRLGYGTLRGSTNKAGVRAMREMRALLSGGTAVTITPDGPRGPRHEVNRGAAFLARATKRPILPVGFGVGRAVRLKSWDRFTLPLPFARVAVVMGEPIEFDERTRGEGELERVSKTIQTALIDAEERAFAAIGEDVDW